MILNEEKAKLLWKLLRNGNTSKNCYDRLEHFKRFGLKVIKNLKKDGLIVISRRGKKFDTIYIPNDKIGKAEDFVEKYYKEVR